MVEVADVAVPQAPRECDLPHHSIAFERSANAGVGAPLAEVSGCDIGGRLEVVGWRPGYQVDRPADRVASIQGALRSAQHLDALQIEELDELHRRAREVDTVEVHRRARIRPGEHDIGADPADRELAVAGVLGQGD